jgi:hypothetical protein
MRNDFRAVGVVPQAVPTLVSTLVSDEEYYVSDINAPQVVARTVGTDTPVFTSRLWGEEREQYAVYAGTLPLYEAGNSGVPATAFPFPIFRTSQAVSDAVLTLSAGLIITTMAVAMPINGPLETHFVGQTSPPLSNSYSALGGTALGRLTVSSRSAEWFGRILNQLIGVEPVIDGYDHAAEGFLRETFKHEPDFVAQWFLSALRENVTPSLVADSLRLLGRIAPTGKEWLAQITAVALRSPSAEVRDAAMQAIESCGDPALVAVLKDHRQNEPRKWLRDYADQIIQDLTEEV